MRGALIHGVLLAIMLVYGYRTWTRDKTVKPNIGNVVLWDKSEADLVALEWKAENKIVRIERRESSYWWGLETTITKKMKKPEPAPANAGSGAGSGSDAGSAAGSGSGAGSGSAVAAGSGAGSGSAAGSAATPPPVEEEERTTREFPLGDNGEKLVKNYLGARALRDLGKPNDQAKKDYKLVDAKTTLTVELKDGKRTFLIGGTVYGGTDRYVMDQQSGKAYVLSKDLISGLEIGKTSLQLTDARGFDVNKISSVTIEAGGKTKTAVRVTAGEEGKQVKTWGDPQTKKPNQTLANFIDNAGNLKPTEYSTTLKPSSNPPLVTLTYKDDRGATLGTLSLYKHEKPAKLPEGAELDPANPPKGETEYYIITPRTRVAAIVRKDNGQRTEQDIPTAFSDKAVDSVDPKGNPFNNPPPGAIPPTPPTGPGADPHGHGANPHGAHGFGAPGAPPPPGGAAPAPPGGAPAPAPGAAPAGGAPAGGAAKPAGGAPAAATPPVPKAAAPAPAKPAAPAPAKPAAPAPAPATPPPAPTPAPAAGSAAP